MRQRDSALDKLHTAVHFTLHPTHTQRRRPGLFIAHLQSIFSLGPRPSDWEGWEGFMWLHQLISIITASLAAAYQPLLTRHSLHLSIYFYLQFTYFYSFHTHHSLSLIRCEGTSKSELFNVFSLLSWPREAYTCILWCVLNMDGAPMSTLCIVCKLMRKWDYFSLDLLTLWTVS